MSSDWTHTIRYSGSCYMSGSCYVCGHYKLSSSGCGLNYHVAPRKASRRAVLDAWLDFLRLPPSRDWPDQEYKNITLCSLHFNKEDYSNRKSILGSAVYLKYDAVPSKNRPCGMGKFGKKFSSFVNLPNEDNATVQESVACNSEDSPATSPIMGARVMEEDDMNTGASTSGSEQGRGPFADGGSTVVEHGSIIERSEKSAPPPRGGASQQLGNLPGIIRDKKTNEVRGAGRPQTGGKVLTTRRTLQKLPVSDASAPAMTQPVVRDNVHYEEKISFGSVVKTENVWSEEDWVQEEVDIKPDVEPTFLPHQDDPGGISEEKEQVDIKPPIGIFLPNHETLEDACENREMAEINPDIKPTSLPHYDDTGEICEDTEQVDIKPPITIFLPHHEDFDDACENGEMAACTMNNLDVQDPLN